MTQSVPQNQTQTTDATSSSRPNRADTRYATPDQVRSCFDYVKAVRGWMLDKLVEDGAFSRQTYVRQGKPFSLELLDSCLEISFLNDTVGGLDDGLAVADINPGCGDRAYRLTTLFPKCAVVCVDSRSCEEYLKYRGCERAVWSNRQDLLDNAKCVIALGRSYGAEIGAYEVPYVFTDSNMPVQYMEEAGYRLKSSRPKWPVGFPGYDSTTYYCWELK